MDDEFGRRWATPEGVLLAGEVLARLKAGAALGELGLGEVGGRVDLRGFPAPPPRPVSRADAARFLSGRLAPQAFVAMAEQVIVEGVPLRGLDLTGARLNEVNFRRCEMDDCVLDRVSGRDLGLTFTRVRGCSFRGAGLRGGGLGGWQDGVCSEYDSRRCSTPSSRTPNASVHASDPVASMRMFASSFHASLLQAAELPRRPPRRRPQNRRR